MNLCPIHYKALIIQTGSIKHSEGSLEPAKKLESAYSLATQISEPASELLYDEYFPTLITITTTRNEPTDLLSLSNYHDIRLNFANPLLKVQGSSGTQTKNHMHYLRWHSRTLQLRMHQM